MHIIHSDNAVIGSDVRLWIEEVVITEPASWYENCSKGAAASGGTASSSVIVP